MCPTCQALYDSYKALKEQLDAASQAVDECRELANAAHDDLSTVYISKEPIDGDIISGCSSVSLMQVKSSLRLSSNSCLSKMNMIESSCPGPDHYEDKEKKNRIK